jgi:hypothetical protein
MPDLTPRVTFAFMVRPRWHDVLIVAMVVGLFAVGVWALWWEDVRHALHLDPAPGSASEAQPAPREHAL